MKNALKTGCMIVFKSIVVLAIMLFVLLIITIIVIVNSGKDPDNRDVCKRMEDYYGETFTLVSTQEFEKEHIYAFSTLQDSTGLECHVVNSRVKLTPGEWVNLSFDDYSAVRMMQTPAVQQLLAQTDYPAQYISDLADGTPSELDSIFSIPREDFETNRIVLSVDEYTDITDALQLAADVVNADECRVSFLRDESEMKKTEGLGHWVNIMPVIQIGTEKMAIIPFGQTEPFTITEKMLDEVQYQFCLQAAENGTADSLPEEAILRYPPTGKYKLNAGETSLSLQLKWDNQIKMFRLYHFPTMRPPIYTILLAGGYELEWNTFEDGFTMEAEIHGKSITMDGTMKNGIRHVYYKGNVYIDESYGSYELSEADLQELFNIRLEIDPLNKTGTIHYE